MFDYKNVLLVEDDPITVMVCERIITMSNFAESVKSLNNGEDALQYLKSVINSSKMPEIIFLDINMPIMNGWEFLKEFEKLIPEISNPPKIYILSSTVDPEDFKKAEMYSLVESFISKPLMKHHLEAIKPA